MISDRRLPPVWLMGLSNLPLGFYSGIAFFVIPQLLASQHVPESRIAGITAAAIAPTFWAFIFGPVLDVRFSRRWYATFFYVLMAAFSVTALLNAGRLAILEAALVGASAASFLGTNALCGWLSTVTESGEKTASAPGSTSASSLVRGLHRSSAGNSYAIFQGPSQLDLSQRSCCCRQ